MPYPLIGRIMHPIYAIHSIIHGNVKLSNQSKLSVIKIAPKIFDSYLISQTMLSCVYDKAFQQHNNNNSSIAL